MMLESRADFGPRLAHFVLDHCLLFWTVFRFGGDRRADFRNHIVRLIRGADYLGTPIVAKTPRYTSNIMLTSLDAVDACRLDETDSGLS